jgi:hypothetical protein
MTSKKKAVDPGDVASPEADDDTEGHSMGNPYLARELGRAREQEIQRSLKAREHVIQAHEAKRPHGK